MIKNRFFKEEADLPMDFIKARNAIHLYFTELDDPRYDSNFLDNIDKLLLKQMNLVRKESYGKLPDQLANDLDEFFQDKGYDAHKIVKILELVIPELPALDIKTEITNKAVIEALKVLNETEGVEAKTKIAVSQLLEEKLSESEEEKAANALREKLFLYASEGYKELYLQYEKEGDKGRLIQLQDIIFQRNNGIVECYFKSVDIYISEELLGWKKIEESKRAMESFQAKNPSYDYPNIEQTKLLAHACPGKNNVEDIEILGKILHCEFIFVEESFDITDSFEYHFGKDGKYGEIRVPFDNLMARTFAVRSGNNK